MNVLRQLAKKDKKWRLLAYGICGCKTTADDLVQEMYIYLKDIEEFTDTFVYYVIKQIYIRSKRKGKDTNNREVFLDNFSHLSKKNEGYSTQDRFNLLEMIKDLTLFEREIVLLGHEMSYRKGEAETGISYRKIHYHTQKVLRKLRDKHGSTER